MKNKQCKIYILVYFYCGKMTELLKGNKALLMYKKVHLMKQSEYNKGKLTIISESGLKYNSAYASGK